MRLLDINIQDAINVIDHVEAPLCFIAIVLTRDLSDTINIQNTETDIDRACARNSFLGTAVSLWRNVYLETPVVWTYKCIQYVRTHTWSACACAVVGWVIARCALHARWRRTSFFSVIADSQYCTWVQYCIQLRRIWNLKDRTVVGFRELLFVKHMTYTFPRNLTPKIFKMFYIYINKDVIYVKI